MIPVWKKEDDRWNKYYVNSENEMFASVVFMGKNTRDEVAAGILSEAFHDDIEWMGTHGFKKQLINLIETFINE